MPEINQNGETLFMAHRLGYGIRAEEYPHIAKQSPEAWLDEQLSAPISDDSQTRDRLEKTTLHIKYDAAPDKWSAVDEMRPLVTIGKPIEDIWPQLFEPQKQINGQERGRPRLETIMATMLRAVYSPYQLREVITQFWHDHFHVNAFADDHIAAGLADYDANVIRKHTFGNFREMLEAVASSTSMQYYLSNHSSRAGSANENYARELFELHSFGREAYLNDHYDRWRDVPGALQGHPDGYIDQDVYEAARAFTGWTIEDGAQIDGGRKLPNTGRFTYVENWHDGYQKRVLANEFDPFAQPMADGRKVLDLIAFHPATARHLTSKLCQRMLGPEVPEPLIARMADAWQKESQAPDQIAKIIRLIALSPEFRASRGSKVKRPLALMAGYVRIMGYDFTPTEGLSNQLANAGQKLFGSPTPAGLPDDNATFLNPNAMRNRWQLMLGLAQNYWATGTPDPTATLGAWGGRMDAGNEIASEFFHLFGTDANEKLVADAAIAAGLVPFAPPYGTDGDKHMALTSAYAASSPNFQVT